MVRLKSALSLTLLVIIPALCQPEYHWSTQEPSSGSSLELIEHPGGTVKSDLHVIKNVGKPYILRNDLIVESNAEVVIEPGVEIRFEPQIGITVRGIMKAVVSCLE